MLKLLKKIWKVESPNITSAALLLGLASLASRLVGLIRDRMLASSFGAGDALDAYYAAFRLPDFFYQLIILGAITAGFIPVFTEYLQRKGDEQAKALAAKVFSTIMLVLVAVCIAFAIFADFLVPYTVPGFTGAKLQETINLARILLISTILLGMSAVMGGILQSMRRFVAFAFAPVLYNLGIISGIIFLVPLFGVAGVAWGVVIGAFFHLAVQAIVALPLGMGRPQIPAFKDKGVLQIIKLTVPRVGALAAMQINLIVLIAFASSLKSGSVAIFNLANNLQFVPIGLIGISFAVASLPAFSKLVAEGDMQGLRQSFLATTRKVFFLIIPATAITLLLRAQIVRILYGAGEFGWDATIRTADVLAMFALSLIAQSAAPVLTRVFYALKDSKTPFIVAAISMTLNIVIAYFFKDLYGVTGLAAAFSIGAFTQFGLLWYLLRKRLGGHLEGKELTISLSKTILASLALFGFGWLARQYVGTIFPLRTFLQVASQAVAATIVGVAAFCTLATLLNVQEFHEFLSAMKSKLLRKAKISEGIDQEQGI
ncbi:murein biosynthesis integral membrane protein MurJ [Candidatus Uhrbacteria bacterium]|nr:murein biosynthesis integral membrane protein MurJ [Candidatus Uhrbacteria bacterium]